MFTVSKIIVPRPSVRVSKMLKSTDRVKQYPLDGHSCHGSHTKIPSPDRNQILSQDVSLTESLSTTSDASLASDVPHTSCPVTCGRLELILGPMFSGKTSKLLGEIELWERTGVKVLAVKSELDTRYATTTEEHKSCIVSHSGGTKECYAVSKLATIKKLFLDAYSSAQVIAIDEAQFFPDLVSFCQKAVDRDAKVVYVAGLDGDFRRKPFKMHPKKASPMLHLIPLADSITKHLAKCHYCQGEAPFTLRTIPETAEVLVGGADTYVPVCRAHYLAKRKEFDPESHEST